MPIISTLVVYPFSVFLYLHVVLVFPQVLQTMSHNIREKGAPHRTKRKGKIKLLIWEAEMGVNLVDYQNCCWQKF